ncbi:DUF1587 domain-containing protein, partial [Rubripirellula sp.]|nr:DUF1587 domain-containing protein [Rubripirellula sp.]
MPYVIRIDNASLGQHFRTQGFYLAACKRRQRPVVITILVGLFSLLASNLFAAEPPAGLTSFLRDTCIDCHDGNTETNLDLSTLEFELKTPANFRQWVHVFDRVQRREMPPTSEPAPDEQNRLDALAQLKAELKTFNQQAQQKAGRVPSRRLSRLEYEHTLHDLLGIGGDLAKQLPPENKSGAFDVVAATQEMSSVHIKGLLNAADLA